MRKWVAPITVACLVLGLLLTLQIRLQNSVLAASSDEKTEVLISLVKSNEAEIADYENKLTLLRQQTDELTAQSTGGTKPMQNKLMAYQTQAGLTALRGPGITVLLDDNKAGLAATPQDDANKYLIHYENIMRLINDLKRGNAEAISVNGQRIIASTEIRCVGNTILINTTRLAPPFEIKAIGDVIALEDALSKSSTYETLKITNFPVSYKTTSPTEQTIDIPAYTGSLQTKHLTSQDKR